MPSRRVHTKLSEALLGDGCNATHAVIDYPYRFLGRRHRILFHDPLSAMLLGYLADGKKGVVSALMHLVEDKYIKPRHSDALLELLDYAGMLVDGGKRKRGANYKLRK
jgi:hypothetical protein